MSFESANRLLGEVFTGSHHEVEFICRRVLKLQHFKDATVDSRPVLNLYNKIIGQNTEERSNFHHGMKLTKSLEDGMKNFPEVNLLLLRIKVPLYHWEPSQKEFLT